MFQHSVGLMYYWTDEIIFRACFLLRRMVDLSLQFSHLCQFNLLAFHKPQHDVVLLQQSGISIFLAKVSKRSGMRAVVDSRGYQGLCHMLKTPAQSLEFGNRVQRLRSGVFFDGEINLYIGQPWVQITSAPKTSRSKETSSPLRRTSSRSPHTPKRFNEQRRAVNRLVECFMRPVFPLRGLKVTHPADCLGNYEGR